LQSYAVISHPVRCTAPWGSGTAWQVVSLQRICASGCTQGLAHGRLRASRLLQVTWGRGRFRVSCSRPEVLRCIVDTHATQHQVGQFHIMHGAAVARSQGQFTGSGHHGVATSCCQHRPSFSSRFTRPLLAIMGLGSGRGVHVIPSACHSRWLIPS
jgi:hypothetical protein